MTHTHTHRIMLFMFSPKAIATKCKGQVSKTLERNREIRKKKTKQQILFNFACFTFYVSFVFTIQWNTVAKMTECCVEGVI